MRKRADFYLALLLCAALLAACFSGCTQIADSGVPLASAPESAQAQPLTGYEATEWTAVSGGAAPVSQVLMPVAAGTTVLGNQKAKLDASNTADGYVMVAYLEQTDAQIRVIVTGPSGVKYTYRLDADGAYDVFPLSDGSGSYSVGVYKNTSGTRYATVFSTSLTVKLKDEMAPFLRPNQYVNYTADSDVVKQACKLTADSKTELDAVKAVYDFVVKNFTYDQTRAKTVVSGYLPDLDDVLKKRSGICFDYAAMMTAMLRSQGIPCKMVVGYAGKTYHSWISVYSQKHGWITAAIYFDGVNWKRMDPTFASTGKSSSTIMKYIETDKNYTAKYLY